MKRFAVVYRFRSGVSKGYFENQLKKTFKDLRMLYKGDTFFAGFSCYKDPKEVKCELNEVLASITALDPASDYIAIYFIQPGSNLYIQKLMLLGREMVLDADMRSNGSDSGSIDDVNKKLIGDLLKCPGEIMMSA